MSGVADGRRRGGVRRTDLRSDSERRVRRAWRAGPGPGLRLASALFGLAADLRNLAHESGMAGGVRAAVPILSVGALTVGGSGKTPVAAEAAGWVRSAGRSPAVVTPGLPDEVAVHRSLQPEVPVVGDRDRAHAVELARRRGAQLVVLDDGFQHRRLGRDLEWVVLEERRAERADWRRLPAGPARDRWAELARADAVILTRRGPNGAGPAGPPAERVGRQFPAAALARCELRPGPLRAANARAEEAGRPRPRVAFASVMSGEDFLDALRRRRPEIGREFLFPDHHPVSDRRLAEMIRAAGEGGMVGTRKDVVKVRGRVGERTPLWLAPEVPVWSHGAPALKRQATRLGGRG